MGCLVRYVGVLTRKNCPTSCNEMLNESMRVQYNWDCNKKPSLTHENTVMKLFQLSEMLRNKDAHYEPGHSTSSS